MNSLLKLGRIQDAAKYLIAQHGRFLLRFFKGQLAIQFLNMLLGFCLLRWLSVTQLGYYSLWLSLYTLLNGLSDFGFSGSITALAGEKFSDKAVLGSYVAAAKKLRATFFWIAVPLVILLAPALFGRDLMFEPWFWIGFVTITVSVLWQADSSIYSAPLLAYKQLEKYYQPQLLGALVRFGISFILYLVGWLSALSLLSINALSTLWCGYQNRKHALPFIELQKNSRVARKNMIRYLLPIMPSSLFNCFMGQIQVFIISILGSIKNVAEVAALGRLAQVFLLLSAFNLVVVEPAIARATKTSLRHKFMLIASGAAGLVLLLSLLAYSMPEFILLVLGNKYQHLQNEVFWLITATGINFLSTTIWTMNSARKWLFWWGTILYITTLVVCQISGFLLMDLSTVLGVMQLSLISSVGILALQVSIAVVGFRKERFKSWHTSLV